MVKIHKQIVMMEIKKLKPYERNAKKHPASQIDRLAMHIEGVGWDQPIVVDEDMVILKGHGRAMAARKIGLTEVPVIVAEGLSEAQKKAVRLADNKLAESEWDEDLLKLDLGDLELAGWDVGELGFEGFELEGEGEGGTEGNTDPDAVPEDAPAVAKRGQIWQLGRHRVMCGDSTSEADVARLMGGENVDLCFTDPPYGISVVGGGGTPKFGKVGGDKVVPSKTYRVVEGDNDTEVAKKAIEIIIKYSKNQVIWGGNYFTDCLTPSRCWFIWDKQNTGNFADAELAWTSFDKSVRIFQWTWNGMSRQGNRKDEGKTRVHPTQKPVGLFCLLFAELEFNTCFEPFLGSGSTLIACEKSGKQCFGIDIEPHYIDTVIKRWEEFTGNKAELIEDAS